MMTMSSHTPTGFGVIPNWMLRDPAIGPYSKLVYAYLQSRADDDGIVFPSQRLVSDELGIGLNSVKRALDDLEDRQLLIRRVERTPTGRRNRYRLLADRLGRKWGVSP